MLTRKEFCLTVLGLSANAVAEVEGARTLTEEKQPSQDDSPFDFPASKFTCSHHGKCETFGFVKGNEYYEACCQCLAEKLPEIASLPVYDFEAGDVGDDYEFLAE